MAYDEMMANRIRAILKGRKGFSEKKMFGGLVFLLNGNMCIGIGAGEELMLRVGKEQYDEMLEMEFVKEMDFTGKALKGFVYVEPEGFDTDLELEKWMEYAISFVKTLPKK